MKNAATAFNTESSFSFLAADKWAGRSSKIDILPHMFTKHDRRHIGQIGLSLGVFPKLKMASLRDALMVEIQND